MNQDPAGMPPQQQPVHPARDAYPAPPLPPGAYPPGPPVYGPGPGYPPPGPPRRSVPKWLLVAIPAVVVALVVLTVAAVVYSKKSEESGTALPMTTSAAASAPESAPDSTTAPAAPAGGALPAPGTKPAAVSCVYRTKAGAQQGQAQLPKTDGVPANTSSSVTQYVMATGQGSVGLSLNSAESPCTVNSFSSLVAQHYFDGTHCHRLTTADDLKVLQCGDPTGTGMGGPGYEFDDEYPTDTFGSTDAAAASGPVLYPRGTLAMANAGPGTNGSQFFLVYGDSQLPPSYTVFGTIDTAGLAVLDKVAAGGTDEKMGPGDGGPKLPVDVSSIQAQ
ncbi:peptidylprolyl isomerase [Nocardia sp. NBC_01327]|uniref:peptidylprolyl isomerase n=1 Tax=Nocardia sp. NBC_01327 TaxID=2903593 RepID=UPI002E0F70D1